MLTDLHAALLVADATLQRAREAAAPRSKAVY
jgi:hypothetical protein